MSAVARELAQAELIAGFTAAHPSGDAESPRLLAELEKTLAEARGIWLAQRRAMADRRAAVARRKELRTRIRQTLLPHLITLGRQGLKEQPELAKRFRPPRHNGSHLAFLRAATLMLRGVTVNRERLLPYAFSDEIVDDAARTIHEFQAAGATAESSRRAHTRATRELRNVLRRIGLRVDRLEWLHIMRFEDYRGELTAWAARREVETVQPGEAARPELRLIS